MTTPDVPLSEPERRVVLGLVRWSKWVSTATVVGGAATMLTVVLLTIVAVPLLAQEPWVLLVLGGSGVLATLLMWQGLVLREAARSFRTVVEAPFPGMIADAIAKLGRYFAIDAALFWGPLAVALLVAAAALVWGTVA